MKSLLNSLQKQQNVLNKLPEVADGIPVRPAVNQSYPTIKHFSMDTEYERINQGFSVAS